jgi:hypothetical protein
MIEFLTYTTERLTGVLCVLKHMVLSHRLQIKKALKILTKQKFFLCLTKGSFNKFWRLSVPDSAVDIYIANTSDSKVP